MEAARAAGNIKIYDLPNPSFIQSAIQKLKGNNLKLFQRLFELDGQTNDRTLNDEDIKNLAAHFKSVFLNAGLGCADEFYSFILYHIHKRHDSDDGDMFPRKYAEIIAYNFITFGIRPKDWKPKNEKLSEATKIYDRRVLDKALYGNK